jgi:zinc transporter 1
MAYVLNTNYCCLEIQTNNSQWVRAEILGAFFNAVFLIALCITIILESITRFIDPPVVDNPKLILIVGCCGLASNLIGFAVLGHDHDHGHGGHSHGQEHGHDNNDASAVEEGRAGLDDSGPAMDVLPQVALAKATAGGGSPETVRRGLFSNSESAVQSPVERSISRSSAPKGQDRRRASSSRRHSRLKSIDDLSIHPASFRQNIIDQSRTAVDDTDDSSTEGGGSISYDESGPGETTPLIRNGANKVGGAIGNGAHKERSISRKPRTKRDSHDDDHQHAASHAHGHDDDDEGMKAMVLHVLGDALGNVGVIVTALIIWLTDWSGKYYADPAVSLFIAAIILRTALPLTRATSHVLLQATPEQIDVSKVKNEIQGLDGVMSCHHVHVWQLTKKKVVASMHVQVAFAITEEGGQKYMDLAKQVRKRLHKLGIHSVTMQAEFCVDERCNHIEQRASRLDGPSSPRCGTGETTQCLLECVDDCDGQTCCSVPPSNIGDGSRKSSHSTHDHHHDDE